MRSACFITIVATLSGCSIQPLPDSGLGEPGLCEILQVYREAVAEAEEDPSLSWHHGWLGNIWINLSRGEARGLCYQWKRHIYCRVRPTVKHVGWEARGVVINKGTRSEHHAVVVYDPERVNLKDLLPAPEPGIAFVLDPWRSGRPLVYDLAEWIESPTFLWNPARITYVTGFPEDR